MVAIVTPQQITINQYQADGLETDYVYSFQVLVANSAVSDITVYVTPPDTPANPESDVVSYTDFTVTNVGDVNGGLVVFDVAPVEGAIVTLVRTMNISITTQFSDAQKFNGANLDAAFQRIVLIMNQLNTDFQFRALQYYINSYLPTATSNQLPILTEVDNQVWVSQNGQIIAATIENDVNVSLLRSQLADESAGGGDGTSLIGYYDVYYGQSKTLQEFLNDLPVLISDVFDTLTPSTGFSTGDLKPSFSSDLIPGWVLWDNGTIGNAASNATNTADASTQQLFTVFWNGYSNTICPIYDSAGVASTRGANAAADYAANKAIALPNGNGRALVNYSGTYTAGEGFGADDVTLVTDQLPSHNHAGSSAALKTVPIGNSGSPVTVYQPTSGSGSADSLALSIVANGIGDPVDVRQPSIACYWYIKL